MSTADEVVQKLQQLNLSELETVVEAATQLLKERSAQAPTGGAVGVRVPNVVGLTVADAHRRIESEDQVWIKDSWVPGQAPLLRVGEIKREPSSEPPETVIQQTPLANDLVITGSTVDLVVASGQGS